MNKLLTASVSVIISHHQSSSVIISHHPSSSVIVIRAMTPHNLGGGTRQAIPGCALADVATGHGSY